MKISSKKILLLLTRYPYPPFGGDKLKSYNLVKILSKNYDLKVIIITDEILTDEVKTFLIENTSSYSVYKKIKLLCIYHSLKGLLKKEPIQISYYYSKFIYRKIKQDINNADILISNSVRTAKYIMYEEKRKYLDIVDAVGQHYIEAINKASSPFWRILYKIEGKRLLKYERKCIEKFDSTFFVNKQEANIYSKYGATEWIPNGVNDKLFKYESNGVRKQSVVFFGKMDYRPNIEAVNWYLDKIHILLPPAYKFLIIGISPCKEIVNRAKKFNNVELIGFVDDPYKILQECAVVVSPMQIGGGIQNKILESMAIGQINILTTKAAMPIYGAINRVHFIIEDDPYSMAKSISEVMNNRSDYTYIGDNAKQLIKSEYTWEKYERQLNKLLR
jgi:glycosyltransferase involved in cell wall biosynthesis